MVSARSPRTGRTIPLLHVNGMSHRPAMRKVPPAREPPQIIRGIRLPHLLLVAVEDPELNGGESRKLSPVPEPRQSQVAKKNRNRASLWHRSVFTVPGRTDLEFSLLLLASWTPRISDSALKTAPTISVVMPGTGER